MSTPTTVAPGALTLDDIPEHVHEILRRAAQQRDKLAGSDVMPMEPGYKEDCDILGLLGWGHDAGLWEVFAAQGKPRVFPVIINGQQITLREADVHGFFLGVLLSLGLSLEPFRLGLA